MFGLLLLCCKACLISGNQVAYDCDRETANHDHRARIGTRVYVPGPFLCSPDGIYQDWLQATAPKQEGRGPCNVCIELVMQGSGAQTAYNHRRENACQNEIRGHSSRGLGLDVLRGW